MEFEKSLFRVHERILSSNIMKPATNLCFIICMTIAIISIPLLIYAHSNFTNQNTCLTQGIREYQTNKNNSKVIGNFTSNNEQSVQVTIEFDEIVRIAIVDKLLDKPDDYPYLVLEYSNTKELIYLPWDVRYNQKYIKNPDNNETFYWNRLLLEDYQNSKISFQKVALNKLWSIITVIFGLFLVSNISAIYTKVTIICAPIFIILLVKCLMAANDMQNQSRLHLYRAFPWLGIYLYPMDFNNRKTDKHVLFAFFCMILLFYFIYLSSIFIWSSLLFNKPLPKGLDENFYGYFAFLEFACLIFIRTRTSIKYFGIITIGIVLIFCFYVKFTLYGFYDLAFIIMCTLICAFLAYLMQKIEQEAIQWNEFATYTPSLNRPRACYFPVFSLNWYHDLPQLWTMFFPMWDRTQFTEAQLSLVDRNYVLLNNVLSNGSQLQNPNNQGIFQDEFDLLNANNNPNPEIPQNLQDPIHTNQVNIELGNSQGQAINRNESNELQNRELNNHQT